MRPILSVLLFAAGLGGAAGQEPGPAQARPDTFWLIPHTHWEGAVFVTREEYLEMGLVNIHRALRLLEIHPGYRFTLDQACYVKPTRIVNGDEFVRYQVLFPTSIGAGRSTHEIPFGASERPEAIEFPAQNWVDHGDGARGLALLNRGLPGNLVTGGTMMLSLARSTRIVAYGFGGGYEPGMSSDSGLERGVELVFDYALVPHEGGWREAGAPRHGLEFNNPLMVRKAPRHPGPLPGRWGLLEVSPPGAVLSALKPGPRGSIILRVHEALGRPATGVTVRAGTWISSAEEADLMEDSIRRLDVEGDALRFDLRPFEIKTLRMALRPFSPPGAGPTR